MEQSTLHRRGVGLRGIDHEKVSQGYTLYTTLTSPGVVHLINNEGDEVHRWNLPYRPGRHARLLPNGNLAYNGVHPSGPNLFPMFQKYRGGVMMEVTPSGETVSSYSDPLAHHDQNHLPDGTLLYTTLSPLTPEESSTILGGIPNSEAPGSLIYGDCIKHVDPRTSETLFSWRAIDNLPPHLFPLQPHYAREHWPLINSVTLLPDGNILASLRSTSGIIIISRTTGSIIWHLDSSIVAQQHCASSLPNNDNNILIFDNGVYRQGESMPYSRVIEVSRSTKQIVWQYTDKSHPAAFFSPFMGSAQRLPGGNTLITEAVFGRIFEVDSNGDIVWEFVNPEFGTYADLAKRAAKQQEQTGGDAAVSDLVKIGFDYPANAVFRAEKYLVGSREVRWLEQWSQMERNGNGVVGNGNGIH